MMITTVKSWLLIVSLVSLLEPMIRASDSMEGQSSVDADLAPSADIFDDFSAAAPELPSAFRPAYKRNPLDKNFIRFGRAGLSNTAADIAKLEEASQSVPEADGSYHAEGTNGSGRSQRGLTSNFIRFGRSFDPYRLQEILRQEFEKHQQHQQQQNHPDSRLPASYQRIERSLASNFLRFGRSAH